MRITFPALGYISLRHLVCSEGEASELGNYVWYEGEFKPSIFILFFLRVAPRPRQDQKNVARLHWGLEKIRTGTGV